MFTAWETISYAMTLKQYNWIEPVVYIFESAAVILYIYPDLLVYMVHG
jgi:hypothetical protein